MKTIKEEKTLIILIIFLLIVFISESTYSTYKSSATGTANAKAATWVVKVNGQDIVESHTFNLNDLIWNNSTSNAKDGTIAPGSYTSVNLTINNIGSEVQSEFNIEFSDIKVNGKSNDNFKVSCLPASSGTIREGRPVNVSVIINWNPVDNENANLNDIIFSNNTISITATVTVKQKLNN